MPLPQLSTESLRWCETAAGSKAQTVTEAVADTSVKLAIDSALNKVNCEAASNAQKVQKWALLQEDFSIPGGELGPTLKVKRHVVEEKYSSLIKTFYD